MLKSKQILKGNLTALSPFLDAEDILRVGGRLNQSDLSYSRKHPILMPHNQIIINLIIGEKHLNLFQADTQATLNVCREFTGLLTEKIQSREIFDNVLPVVARNHKSQSM